MIIDVAHASTRLIDDTLRFENLSVMCSHSGVYELCPNARNVKLAQIEQIVRNGGFFGLSFFPAVLCVEYSELLDAIVSTIKYLGNHVGYSGIGLGSDWDGAVEVPMDASNIAQLTHRLLQANISEDDIRGVMGENFKRFLLQALPMTDERDMNETSKLEPTSSNDLGEEEL
uniref:Dipeptidase n=1 Tax=Compsopogon caeruleus TaxID=31354 RepID=A0A7S1TF35_9RHOD|mmetsp:Transcript_3157/g.5987  ORF Transcript_3157/g.5987 Transcript_3157/m.5987 type:complete len:172 (+) Transcript_3157:237-752(+)